MGTLLVPAMVFFPINILFSFLPSCRLKPKKLFLNIGPDTWAADFGNYCNGTAQSPIDIPYDGVTKRRDWLPFQLLNYEIDPYKMYIANNGHTAVVTFEPRNCKKIPTVVQGNLPGTMFCKTLSNISRIRVWFIRSAKFSSS